MYLELDNISDIIEISLSINMKHNNFNFDPQCSWRASLTTTSQPQAVFNRQKRNKKRNLNSRDDKCSLLIYHPAIPAYRLFYANRN